MFLSTNYDSCTTPQWEVNFVPTWNHLGTTAARDVLPAPGTDQVGPFLKKSSFAFGSDYNE